MEEYGRNPKESRSANNCLLNTYCVPRTIPGGMYKWTAWQDKGESWWHQVSGVPEVWPAGAEAVTSQLIPSDILPKLRQLTAYLQLSAEGPFVCLWKHTGAIFKSSQNPWSQHSTNDGYRVGGQMPQCPCLSVATILSPRMTSQEGVQLPE